MGEYEIRKQDKSKLLIPLLLLITLIAVGVTIWALFFRSTGPVLAPDYAPQEMEQTPRPPGSPL